MSPIESLARHICTTAGENPDEIKSVVTSWGRQTIGGLHPDAVREDRPRWRHYEDFARNWLAAEEWRAGQ